MFARYPKERTGPCLSRQGPVFAFKERFTTMGLFHDSLAGIRGEDGSLTIGDDFEGSLTAAYDADMQGPTAAVEALQAELEKVRAELVQAQAANWLLVQDGYGLDGSAPSDEGAGDAESDPENAAEEVEDTPEDDESFFLGDDDDDDDDNE
ncbi:hypothetical protein [Curtobacterium phage Reje]|uniref:hypothetical protein n=1 Tax=Curtobacterium phage Reje TaxID=2851069 RepID=UPI0021F9ACC1|nr:hypothetical protein QEJ62_gp05 [Curtobacterium phage Reje]QXG07813.1 hypothetical protein [Curtobacterium phage Reje]